MKLKGLISAAAAAACAPGHAGTPAPRQATPQGARRRAPCRRL